jgi:hypothetical protein
MNIRFLLVAAILICAAQYVASNQMTGMLLRIRPVQ